MVLNAWATFGKSLCKWQWGFPQLNVVKAFRGLLGPFWPPWGVIHSGTWFSILLNLHKIFSVIISLCHRFICVCLLRWCTVTSGSLYSTNSKLSPQIWRWSTTFPFWCWGIRELDGMSGKPSFSVFTFGSGPLWISHKWVNLSPEEKEDWWGQMNESSDPRVPLPPSLRLFTEHLGPHVQRKKIQKPSSDLKNLDAQNIVTHESTHVSIEHPNHRKLITLERKPRFSLGTSPYAYRLKLTLCIGISFFLKSISARKAKTALTISWKYFLPK